MDHTQSPNDDVIDSEITEPKIGISITPCEDSKSSTSDPISEHVQSPSKYKLPISITDLWRIRRKDKLKKRFSAKNLMLVNDDGDDDSDSYSFDHDSLATPSVNTSQIDPSVDSDNGEFSWSSDNSPTGSSSSLDSASPEESWGSPPYGNIKQDSHGSSEDPLSQEESSRRASICTIIDSNSRSPVSFSIPKPSNSESSSDSNIKSECTIDENEEFKQIMRDMTIASFSNKKLTPYSGSDESIGEHSEQLRRLSIVVDPIALFSSDNSLSTADNFPPLKPEILNKPSKEMPNIDYTNKIDEKDVTNELTDGFNKNYNVISESSGRNNGYKDYVTNTESNNSSTKEIKIEPYIKEIDINFAKINDKSGYIAEKNIKSHVDNSSHGKSNITQSSEFKKIEKSIGLGIDKSCFWCCEIL